MTSSTSSDLSVILTLFQDWSKSTFQPGNMIMNFAYTTQPHHKWQDSYFTWGYRDLPVRSCPITYSFGNTTFKGGFYVSPPLEKPTRSMSEYEQLFLFGPYLDGYDTNKKIYCCERYPSESDSSNPLEFTRMHWTDKSFSDPDWTLFLVRSMYMHGYSNSNIVGFYRELLQKGLAPIFTSRLFESDQGLRDRLVEAMLKGL